MQVAFPTTFRLAGPLAIYFSIEDITQSSKCLGVDLVGIPTKNGAGTRVFHLSHRLGRGREWCVTIQASIRLISSRRKKCRN